MSYYHHATEMALRLGQWGGQKRPKPYEKEAMAAQLRADEATDWADSPESARIRSRLSRVWNRRRGRVLTVLGFSILRRKT